jgi:hypothetical protein
MIMIRPSRQQHLPLAGIQSDISIHRLDQLPLPIQTSSFDRGI